MDPSAPFSSLCLFRETILDLDSLPTSVVQIQLPSSSPFTVRSRQRQQHRLIRTAPVFKDDDAYGRNRLATSASIHFSHNSTYPRSILWRVLEEQKVLELRSTDLSKDERETKEAGLTIQLCFPVQIRDGGVALADSEDQSILNVYALTKGNELYTCSVRRSFFCHAAASEEDAELWCKTYKPATFSMSNPHRLFSSGPSLLIVSLSDGRVLTLTKSKGHDGSRWTESVYGDGQWGSTLLGLVRWQGSNAVRYDGTTLEQNTPLSIALSPDDKHIFAVCLDHTIRVWNPTKAASVFSEDLLTQNREPQDKSRVMLNPGDSNFLRLFRSMGAIEGDSYYAVTFSPHDYGQFKFWAIRDPDHGEKGIRDLFPEFIFKAPDADPSPDSKEIWKVADFNINARQDDPSLAMWILMRSNRSYRLYQLKFDLEDLETQWQDSWSVTTAEGIGSQPSSQSSDLYLEDVTEKWLGYLLKPGRFPRPVLETALCIYNSDELGDLESTKASLKQRLYFAIESRVKNGIKRLNPSEFRDAIHKEWSALSQDVLNLNKQRREVLSLAVDNATGMPWLVFRDATSAIRSCSRTEIIGQNNSKDLATFSHLLEKPSIEIENDEEPRLPDELAILIMAAARFRRGFKHDLQIALKTALASELWLEPASSIPLRLQAFYDQCDFAEDVGTEQFTDLAKTLEVVGGFDNLDTSSFSAIINSFAHDMPSVSSESIYTGQGLKFLVEGAREMIEQRERILTDLLALVTVVEMEIDRDEFAMQNFDGPQIFETLLDLLKRYQVMQWLATNTRNGKAPNRRTSLSNKTSKAHKQEDSELSSSVLESIFAHDLKPQSTSTQSQSEVLTEEIQDLLQWVVGGNNPVPFEEVPVYIQCDLLRNGDLEQAASFLGFQPSTAWSTYITGRFHLMRDQPSEAAIYFKRAAFKLSRPSNFDFYGASSGLLSSKEAGHFGEGLPTYYAHIISLFGSASNHTQVAQFAHLALQLLPPTSSLSASFLHSLFTSSLAILDIPTAFSALTRHPNATTTLLPIFLRTLLNSPTPSPLPHLLSLPFPSSFYNPIDTLLCQHTKNPQLLSAWRLHHNDPRGAAAALLPSLHLQQQQYLRTRGRKRNTEREIDESYLAIINLLVCAGPGEGWILNGGGASGLGGDGVGGVEKPEGARRKVVTLNDMRGNYGKELDRREALENGRFEFGGDAMDVS